MDEKRIVIGGVSVVIAVATITILAVTLSSNTPGATSVNFTSVLLISMDGFRADYITRGLTPTLSRLAEEGVSTFYMKPSYPTITFPNHYTIVTGLLPQSHGIIANSFYDPVINEFFNMNSNEGKWWGGEPMWLTVKLQDKRSATCFWPGSDSNITGTYADYWYPYSYAENMSFESRVDQVLDWLSQPAETRPHWVSLYFDEPDHTAHDFGPETTKVDRTLAYMDGVINRLNTGLRERNLKDSVNIIIVADHGMTSAGPEKVIILDQYVSNLDAIATKVYDGSFSRIRVENDANYEQSKLNILSQLTCKTTTLRAYAKEDLPRRLHFSNNPRIEDIVLDMDEGFITNRISDAWSSLGVHGYDNYYTNMNALFIASGPDFRKNVVLEPFQNTELYNLMCHLTGVEPATNDGTFGSLNDALIDPPAIPKEPTMDDDPPPTLYPIDDVSARFNISDCPDEFINNDTNWLEETLQFSQDQMNELDLLHLPWGVPQSANFTTNSSLTLLYHHDHITAYSKELKLPLWTSLTLSQRPNGTKATDKWLSDIRLELDTTPTCPSYDTLDYSMYPLFHPLLIANDTYDRVPFLVSNAVAVSDLLQGHWEALLYLLLGEVKKVGYLNLLVGPILDWTVHLKLNELVVVPTDLFAVATWCRQPVSTLDLCPHLDLRAYSFLYPQKEMVSNCLSEEMYSREYSGRVKDVEQVTGLTLYPDINIGNRTQLLLRITPPIWPLGQY